MNTFYSDARYKRQFSIHSTYIFKNDVLVLRYAIPLMGILIIIKLSNVERKMD